MIHQYKTAPWDVTAWIVSLLAVCVIGAAISFGIIFTVFADRFLGFIGLLSLVLIIGPITFAVYCLVDFPCGYTITEQGISINQRLENIVIKFSQIQLIDVIDYIAPRWRLRNGGFLGYSGTFFLKGGKEIFASCTRWQRVVLINTAEETYIISPQQPDEFSRVVHMHLNKRILSDS